MLRKSIGQIAEMITIQNDISTIKKINIAGICIDSRSVQQGNLFIPFKGENVDGHQYVEDAIKKGAAASLWQKDVPNPPIHLPIMMVDDSLVAIQKLAAAYRKQLPVKVIAITGSNGKTTTKDILANLLSLQYKVQKTEGNYNNHLGLPLSILQLEEDTEFAVLEMGMSGKGEIALLTKIARPDAVIITNIGESHLLHLGSREGIAAAKLEILEGLKDNGLIVYYGDEPLLKQYFIDYRGSGQIKTFGIGKENTVYPTTITPIGNGNRFTIPNVSSDFCLPILGDHNILNTLAAMLTAHHYQLSYDKMNNGLANLKLTGMRMELVEGASGEKIINDAYNASPTSMKAAIQLVMSLSNYDKKIVVLGDILELGAEENIYHKKIGEALDPEEIDFVFTYGKLGRKIAEGALRSFSPDRVFAFEDKILLISELKQIISKNDLVLVKASRGMKLEEVVHALKS